MKEWNTEQVESVAASGRARIERLPPEEADRIRDLVFTKFVGECRSAWPWEQLEGPAIHDGSACGWIADFVGPRECVMFFGDEPAAFRFRNGDDLRLVLERQLEEIYVTDARGEYLLCFNHHEVLVAAGSASCWLQDEVERRQRSGP
jgi:hypothetical protein